MKTNPYGGQFDGIVKTVLPTRGLFYELYL